MLTLVQRAALKCARAQIRNRQERFICIALIDSGLVQENTALPNYIQKQIRPYDTLDCWQQAHGIYHSPRQLRADRLAWIDWMLGEES